MFWQSSQLLGLSANSHAPPRPASSGISGHQPRNVIDSDPKQARRSSAVRPSPRFSAVNGGSGQARSCSTRYGAPASLAAAAQPNQIGQLNGSVSGSPAQPVFAGRPSPETRYQRKPSASVGPPATNDSAPSSSVPRRSPESPGAPRIVKPSTVVATMASKASSGGAGGSADGLAAALALWSGDADELPDADALAVPDGLAVGEVDPVGSPEPRVSTRVRRMPASTARKATPAIIARGARCDPPFVVGGGGGGGPAAGGV